MILLFFIYILSFSTAHAKSPPPGTGSADVPANILLLIDTSGSMDEVLINKRTEYPMDVAFDSDGNIYVANYYHEVSKYDPDGNFILKWGKYKSSYQAGRFYHPYNVVIDNQDRVYVSDRYHGRVQIFDTSGNFINVINPAGEEVYGIALDAQQRLYVVNGSGDIEVYNTSWSKIATWDTHSSTRQIAITADNRLFVTRYSDQSVREYDVNGGVIQTWALSYRPMGIEITTANTVLVGDLDGDRVYEYSFSGAQQAVHGSYGSDADEFNQPRGMARHPVNGTVYIADYYNHRIKDVAGNEIVGTVETRLDTLKDVLKTIVSDSDLTSGANFGLLQWNTDAQMEVEISDTGAQEIYNTVDSLTPGGWTHLETALGVGQNYILGPTSPRDPSLPCQQTIFIVLSDGEWQDFPNATAANLFDNYGIKTFIIGFATTGSDNYVTLSQNGGTYPDSPLFASNKENLLEVLSTYIRQIISTQLTFSTPTIIPGVTNEDFILQSTFTYKANNQWKGRFLKYPLGSDGNVAEAVWDAGEVLNATPADDRKLWTVNDALPLSLNNFTAANVNALRDMMEATSGVTYTDEELSALIQFVRGKDSYAEFPLGTDDEDATLLAGERWKLADIYHSRAVVVGPPKAFVSDIAHVNSEAYYRYVNGYKSFRESTACGGVCKQRQEVVYVGSNAGMLHAFDSATGAEKWAFIPPVMLPHFKDMIALETGKSISIYGVDGSPIVKDVRYGGQWRTVLMAGMRQGGHGYFALDITNPDDPKHLFSFMFEPLTQTVYYWDAEGVRSDYDATQTLPAAFDYSQLGESWSSPVIMNLPDGVDGNWVAVVGGGYNNAVNTQIGARLYVFDLENGGQVLQNIAIGDTVSGNGIESSVPPRVTAITADSTPLFTDKGALIYVNDLEGKFWKVNLTDQGTLYDKTAMFNAESTWDNDRLVYHEATAALTEDDVLMLYFGTADMQRIGRVDESIANRAYGLLDRDFSGYSSTLTKSATNLLNTTGLTDVCPDGTQYGWYSNLNANEKITGRISIKNNTVFLPRYTPNEGNLCSAGAAALSEVDYLCGETVRTTPLGAGMPTEVIVYKNKVYVGISSDAAATGTLPDGFVKQGNLIVGDPARLSPATLRIEAWEEEF